MKNFTIATLSLVFWVNLLFAGSFDNRTGWGTKILWILALLLMRMVCG